MSTTTSEEKRKEAIREVIKEVLGAELEPISAELQVIQVTLSTLANGLQELVVQPEPDPLGNSHDEEVQTGQQPGRLRLREPEPIILVGTTKTRKPRPRHREEGQS